MRKFLTSAVGLAMVATMFAPSLSSAKSETAGIAKFSASDDNALDHKGDDKGMKAFHRIAEDSAYAFVKGRVTAISTTSISVSVMHHADSDAATLITTVYTFNIDSITKVIRKFKGTAGVNEVSVGDLVSVWASDLTNGHARLIWDQSIWWGEVKGTVSELDVTNNTFKLILKSSENHGITTTSVATIVVDTNTTYSKDGVAKTLSDLANGQKVKIRGSWNNPDKSFLAKTVAIQS